MNQEFDLLDFLKKAVRVFTKNIRIFILILFISLAASIGLRYGLTPTYQSQMIVQSDILTEPFTNNIAKSINDLIKTKTIGVLQEKLSLTNEETQALKEIKIESLEEKRGVIEQKDDKSAFFRVTVKVSDNQIFPKLQKGLIKYVEENEYVKIRVDQRKEYYKQAIVKVDREIKALDSLKDRITRGQAFAGGGSNIFFDPTNVYSRSIELFKEKVHFEQALQLANSVQLIEGFNVPNRPSSPGLLVYVPAGFGIGILLFCLYLMVKGLVWLSKQED